MVVEYIRYTVEDARAEAFEEAYRQAAGVLEASEHCERFGAFFAAVQPFVDDIEEMRHYEVTLTSDT
jgi:hypothetical protein